MKKYIKIIQGLFRLSRIKLVNLNKLKINGIFHFIGNGVTVDIYGDGCCNLGNKTWLSNFCSVECNNGQINIGYNNFFNSNCKIVSLQEIEIGDNNLFGPNVIILDHNHVYDKLDIPFCKQGFKCDKVTIGNNIWIGANSIITKGVKICDNVVIAANTVVNKSIQESGVYAGAPVRIIKKF